MSPSLEELVREAQGGSKSALGDVIARVQNQVYGLALRMLWHPEDARDAAQEILVRIITHLGGFRGDSRFMTWVYRVASNYLVSVRRSRLEQQSYRFDRFGEELDQGLSDAAICAESDLERNLLLEEVRVGCTMGMLLCLDRAHRLAYILGEILEIEGSEAAKILEITAANYRQQLVRARRAIVAFMMDKCGLANPTNRCRCHRRVDQALATKRIDPGNLLFANEATGAENFPPILALIRSLEEARRAAAIYRAQPTVIAPKELALELRKMVDNLGV
jgi:RNA polymerase sigma factor (sigma-70 family)